MSYWAHSQNSRGDRHDLSRHLLEVAEKACEFAEPFGAGPWAYCAGLWHDLGKFSAAFQQYLTTASDEDAHASELRGSVDHSSAGAQHAAGAVDVLGHVLAYAIAGHHAGLLDAIGEFACQQSRLDKRVEPWEHGLAFLPPSPRLELPPFLKEALSRRKSDRKGAAFKFAFFTRMVFSCLVDADSLDTEAFFDPERAKSRPSWPPDILERMSGALEEQVEKLGRVDLPVNKWREEVRRACRNASRETPGFFSLTVPTGGGKTLSSLAFALEHATWHGLRRVIYVVPFTTIIEQNAEVFRQVFAPLVATGCADPVVEHHSAVDVESETLSNRLAADNWDAPLIVTTAVQFYESLFARRGSRCRKLHNISASVIVLDEAQKLPVDYLIPCMRALQELTGSYRCSILLCTATQPAIDRRIDFPDGLAGVREIVPDPRRLSVALRRTEQVDLGTVTDQELVQRLASETQVLCVVNTRGHARQLFEMIVGRHGVIHLSAAMCPRHRVAVLKVVRDLLQRGEPCRVVCTQLVEAGVDLDFPVVFRSFAGLDSIVQAAGRCNRNGRLDRGILYVFRSEHSTNEAFLRDTLNAATQVLGDGSSIRPLYDDILCLEAVEQYFRLYYWTQAGRWDAHAIMDRFRLENSRDLPLQFDFKSASASMRLIQDSGRPVIVPWEEEGQELCRELEKPWIIPPIQMLRELQLYTVQTPLRVWNEEVGRSIRLVREKYPVLAAPAVHYDERLGLVLDRQRLKPSETFI